MKLERRNVYVKELWSMSYGDRYVYAIVNMFTIGFDVQLNPLKWSLSSLWFAFILIIATLILPFYCLYVAHQLKTDPMPESEDPMFKGGDDWYMSNKWVVKRPTH